jgi:hypothetical protein
MSANFDKIRFKSAIRLTAIAVLISTCALFTAWLIKSELPENSQALKMKRLVQNENRKAASSGKASSPFNIELNSATGVGTETVAFDALVTLQTEPGRGSEVPVEFEWLTPEGARFISGLKSGLLGSLKPGESQRVSAVFQITNPSLNQHVHLHVFRMIDGEPHGQMAQFNTGANEETTGEIKLKSEEMKERTPASGRMVE